MENKNTAITEQLRNYVEKERNGWIQELCHSLHPATLADHLDDLERDEVVAVFRLLEAETQAEIFMLLDIEHRRALLDDLSVDRMAAIVTGMHHDDRVDLLQEMSAEQSRRVLQSMAESEREDVLLLDTYPEDTVGAVTTTEYIRLSPSVRVDEAVEHMRARAQDTDIIYYGYVLDEDNHLLGTVSLKDLIMARSSDPVGDIMHTDVVSVQADEEDLVAARKLSRYDLVAIPVLDESGQMLGIAAFDDIIDVLEEEASETMYRKAGIGDVVPSDETDVIYSKKLTQGSIWYPVRLRILFLLITLAGGLLVGGVIEHFEETLAAVVAAAIFIPVIMDMGGNVGTQSTTIFARGVALGHIDVNRFGGQLVREVGVGVIMGVVLGLLGGAVAYYWQGLPHGVPELGVAVGVALAVVIPLATLLGFLLPWILVKLGIDHASGADPFITTIKDFVSLALYFTLINVLIGL